MHGIKQSSHSTCIYTAYQCEDHELKRDPASHSRPADQRLRDVTSCTCSLVVIIGALSDNHEVLRPHGHKLEMSSDLRPATRFACSNSQATHLLGSALASLGGLAVRNTIALPRMMVACFQLST